MLNYYLSRGELVGQGGRGMTPPSQLSSAFCAHECRKSLVVTARGHRHGSPSTRSDGMLLLNLLACPLCMCFPHQFFYSLRLDPNLRVSFKTCETRVVYKVTIM